MWKWIALVVVVLGIAGIVYASMTQTLPVDVSVTHRGTITAFVEEQARTRLPRTYKVTMPIDGRILPITLEEGDRVTERQVIARMDTEDLETAVVQAQARVRRLEASVVENNDTRLEVTLLEGLDHELEAIDRTVEASEAKTEASRARETYRGNDLERIRVAHEDAAATDKELEQAQLDEIESRVDYRMDVLILRAIEAVRDAARMWPLAVKQYMEKKGLKEAVMAQELAEAQAALDMAERDLARAAITAPTDGVVLERFVSNRRVLPVGQLLMEIGRLEDLEVEVEVLSQEVVSMTEGDRVEIIGPSIGTQPVTGGVRRIEPRGFTKISSLGVEQQRVRVIVDFDPGALDTLRAAGRDLGVGFRVRARIHTDEAADTIIVPRSALFRGPAGGWQTFTIRGGRATLVDLETGLMNNVEAQVLSGLGDEEEVILAPATSLEDGERVEAR